MLLKGACAAGFALGSITNAIPAAVSGDALARAVAMRRGSRSRGGCKRSIGVSLRWTVFGLAVFSARKARSRKLVDDRGSTRVGQPLRYVPSRLLEARILGAIVAVAGLVAFVREPRLGVLMAATWMIRACRCAVLIKLGNDSSSLLDSS